MKETRFTYPEVGLIGGTRALFGLGLGLLMGSRLSDSQRKTAGWTLLLVGAASALPLVLTVLSRSHELTPADRAPPDDDADAESDLNTNLQSAAGA